MAWLFGKKKEEPAPKQAAPSLQEASAKIDLQVQGLDDKIVKTEEEIKRCIAKGASNAAAKQRAVNLIKRKKMFEQQRDTLMSTQFNVESMALQQENADIALTAVEALKHGQQELKKKQDKMSIDEVERINEDIADTMDELNMINEALTQTNVIGNVDEDAVDEEYAKLQEEMVAMTLAGGSASTAPATSVAAPSTAPAVAAPKPAAVPTATP